MQCRVGKLAVAYFAPCKINVCALCNRLQHTHDVPNLKHASICPRWHLLWEGGHEFQETLPMLPDALNHGKRAIPSGVVVLNKLRLLLPAALAQLQQSLRFFHGFVEKPDSCPAPLDNGYHPVICEAPLAFLRLLHLE